MKYLYNFEQFAIRMSEESIDGFDEIGKSAFNAFFETQSTKAGSGLYYRKNDESLELVRRNGGEEVVDVANLKDIVWIDCVYLPQRPSQAHEWNGTEWVVDADVESAMKAQDLANLKADLCAKIDARAIEVGDSKVKSSVYLTLEYKRNLIDAKEWKDAGYTGEPPLSIKTGAESHGLTYQEEAELILRESATAEGFIEILRTWRMTAKGVQGIQGATTVETAQAIYDDAIADLDSAMEKGKS